MSVLLKTSKLSKKYGDFDALQGLDFEILKGQCVGLLGSNGAGKSTTIRMITGQIQPSSGQVEVLGVNPATHPKDLHAFVGYIPDSQSLYEDLSVQVNIEVFARLYGRGIAETTQIVHEVHLSEKANEKVKNLSKGLKQRVLIARALVHNPSFIILDEPTTGLDPSSAESIYGILDRLKKNGATILLTTHLMNDVERLCDHIVFLDKGRKVEEGSPEVLKQTYGTRLEDIFIQLVSGRK